MQIAIGKRTQLRETTGSVERSGAETKVFVLFLTGRVASILVEKESAVLLKILMAALLGSELGTEMAVSFDRVVLLEVESGLVIRLGRREGRLQSPSGGDSWRIDFEREIPEARVFVIAEWGVVGVVIESQVDFDMDIVVRSERFVQIDSSRQEGQSVNCFGSN